MTLATDLSTRSLALGTQVVSDLSRWFHDGSFNTSHMVVWPFNTFSAAALLASLVKQESPYSATYIQMIREIMRRVEDTDLGTGHAYDVNGSLPYGGWPDSEPKSQTPPPMSESYGHGPTRTSMQGYPPNRFGVDALNVIESCHPLAWMIWQLPEGSITVAERRRWTGLCQDMCDYLDTDPTGTLTYFYVNGNYAARTWRTYWYTAMISKPGPVQEKYRDMYERALQFGIDPAQYSPAWAGYGWITSFVGGYSDWSDYTGYLTEEGGGGVGLDWGYAMVAAEALAGIYLCNRDDRILRMLNAISTTLIPRINETRWVLDGTGGTRQGGNNYGMSSGYQYVQGLLGIKQSNNAYLTSAKLLDLWDHDVGGDGGVYHLLGTQGTTNGIYSASQMDAWYTTIALVIEAAYQARPKAPAV